MMYRRFHIPFLLVLPVIIIIHCSLSFAQYTTYYNPILNYQTSTIGYPNYQNTSYSGYQTSSYWPNLTGSYFDPYSQAIPYNVNLGNYASSLNNIYNPYGTVSPYGYSPLSTLNTFYNYAPLGYSYASVLNNPLSSFGFPLNLAGVYNTQISPTNTTTNGTTSSDGSSGANYATQATSYYPSILSGLTTPYQIDPYALSAITLSNLYLNPLGSYLPNQNYYQNPYVSYPYNYNIGQVNTVNPYQSAYTYNTYPYTSNTINPYNQQIPYTQPLPYYQTNSNTTSSEANLVNVNGTWAGTWFTTLADGTVNNGDATLSLTQNGIELYGNISFSINSYQKLNTNLNGTINGSSLNLTGILINGAEFYTLSVNGNISGTNLSGTYSINTNSGAIIESGTYNIAHL